MFTKTHRDDQFDNEFKIMMRSFKEAYPLDRIFDSIMAKSGGKKINALHILIYAELRRIAASLEVIANEKLRGK